MREIQTINDFISNDYQYIFTEIQELLTKLNNTSILITGITGFIGKNILRTLIEFKKNNPLNISIIGISRNPEKFLIEYPEFQDLTYLSLIEADISSPKFANQINLDLDYIIHSATDTTIPENNNEALYQFTTIVEGTYNLIKLSKKYKLKQFLYLSSGAVYGFDKVRKEDFRETIDVHSIIETDFHAYRDGKRIAEKLVQSSFSQDQYTIARGFSFFGEYFSLNSHFAFSNFLNSVLKKQNITIKGDGKTIRSYLHSSDMIIYIFKMLLNKHGKNIFNLGSSQEISIKELAEWIISTSKEKNTKLSVLEQTDGKAKYYVPDLSNLSYLG
ncbi:MAG: NAD(P)-dependent oxidoreductase [Candidatus Caenarcaniphilales bacterium]|nr:NAD(P)-dependent oxidoreductase [Candidatus Caenarcaniphilales bacterium]